MMLHMKINVAVKVKHEIDGKQIPIAIVWEDGREFEIDQVTDVCRAASLKAGGAGNRYTCRIKNRYFYLFDEVGYWFLEGKNNI